MGKSQRPLLLKTTPSGGLNMPHSQTSGNLYLSPEIGVVIPSLPTQLWWKVTELQETQAQRQKRQKRPSLLMERTHKPQVELEKQISQLGILSILPTWSSCMRGKIKIVSDVVVLTIL